MPERWRVGAGSGCSGVTSRQSSQNVNWAATTAWNARDGGAQRAGVRGFRCGKAMQVESDSVSERPFANLVSSANVDAAQSLRARAPLMMQSSVDRHEDRVFAPLAGGQFWQRWVRHRPRQQRLEDDAIDVLLHIMRISGQVPTGSIQPGPFLFREPGHKKLAQVRGL